MNHRPLSNIAHDIRRDMRDSDNWQKKYYAAMPYLNAMLELDQITDKYMFDSAKSIVTYFLSNAGQWKGPVAKTLKAELKAL